MQQIESNRIIMLPITYNFVCEKISRKQTYIEKLGYSFDEEQWNSSELAQILPIFKGQLKGKDNEKFCPWLIIFKDTKRVIGNCGCHGEPDEHGIIEVGFEVDEDYRNNGIATEALETFLTFIKDIKIVNTIIARCDVMNIKSQNVLKKVGMSEYGKDDNYIIYKYNLNCNRI